MLRVGDRIRLSSGRGPDREGVVTALVGSMLRVRWPSQEETLVSPGPGTLTVLSSTVDDAQSALPPGQPTNKNAAGRKAAPKEMMPKKAAPKKAVAKATPKKAESSKAAPTKRTPAAPTTVPAKPKAPTRTGARKATDKSGSDTPTRAKRQGG
jgi:hypothetical protein